MRRKKTKQLRMELDKMLEKAGLGADFLTSKEKKEFIKGTSKN